MVTVTTPRTRTNAKQESKAKTPTQFAIVADVEFIVSRVISGAFNSHHAANLVKVGTVGKVTPTGATFFSNRPRMTMDAMMKTLQAGAYDVYDAGGFAWAKKNDIPVIPGQGELGKSLFAYALAKLTSKASK